MSDRPTHSAPIDAEFEPADEPRQIETSYEKPARSGGPGWIALTFVGLLAMGSFAFALWSSGLLKQDLLPAPGKAGLAAMQTGQDETARRVGELSAQVEGLIDRVDTEIARIDNDLDTVVTDTRQTARSETNPEFEARLMSLEDKVAGLADAGASAIDPARIEAIEAALESAGSSGGASNGQLVSLRTELEALKTELASLEAGQQAFSTEIETLRADATEIGRTSAKVVSASLALAAIEATSARGEPFEEPYNQLAEARPDDSDVKALASLSRIGIPPLEALKGDFRRLRNTALARDTEDSSGLGWVNTVFGESVSIRRTDTGSETADRLADAEAALARDDLRIAIEAVEALPESQRAVFQTWLADARRRARLEDSLEDLRLKLIAAGQ